MPSRTCHVKFLVGIPAAAIMFLSAHYPSEARTEQSGGTDRNGEWQAGDVRTHTDQQYSRDGQRRNHQGEQQWKHISGTIKRTKQVELRGQDQDNLIVQLQTNRGDKIIVDLGNAEHIEELDLQKGHRLSAWGRTGRQQAQDFYAQDWDQIGFENDSTESEQSRSQAAMRDDEGQGQTFKRTVQKALDHAKKANEAGKNGNSQQLVQHSQKAMEVAKQAQRAGNNERLNEGVYALGEAIEHGRNQETKDAREHVMHAIMKLSQSADIQIPEGAIPSSS